MYKIYLEFDFNLKNWNILHSIYKFVILFFE